MLITKTAKQTDIPHEPGEWLKLRRLSWRELDEAKEAQVGKVMKKISALGADLVTAIQSATTVPHQDQAKAYDRGTVLRAGIIGWSYDADVTPENIDALDPETADWAFDEILALSSPESDGDKKNA